MESCRPLIALNISNIRHIKKHWKWNFESSFAEGRLTYSHGRGESLCNNGPGIFDKGPVNACNNTNTTRLVHSPATSKSPIVRKEYILSISQSSQTQRSKHNSIANKEEIPTSNTPFPRVSSGHVSSPKPQTQLTYQYTIFASFTRRG